MPPKLGTHVSIAGGMNLAIDRGRELGCDAIQVFTKNASQWKAKPLDPCSRGRRTTLLEDH